MRLAHQRGFTLTYEMTNWIERTLPRDMRTLSRVLAAVDRLSLMTQRPVTFPLLREAVQVLQRDPHFSNPAQSSSQP